MDLVTKKDLDTLIGKTKLLYPSLVTILTYIAGVPEIDAQFTTKSAFDIPCSINIVKREKGLEIGIQHLFKSYYTYIENNLIESIVLEDIEQVTRLKDKSVVGRAIIGGTLGPVGAIIGGMTALKPTVKNSKMPDLFITITTTNEEQLIMSCRYKDKNMVFDFFRSIYPTKFRVEK